MILKEGDKLGKYEIIKLIGEGGMGAVYKAQHIELGKNVALKVLKSELAQNETFLQRFKLEAKAAAKLSHPNIVTVHDIGQESDLHYFILDYIEGEDLEQIIKKEGKLSYAKAKEIIKQISIALDYVHSTGIIHRDIKTRNIMVDKSGNAILMDFGIARDTEETRLTMTGTFMGTVEYMSPEQAEGKPVDHRSDIYSLGIVFYELLTGDVPFKAETSPVTTAMKHITEIPISPKDKEPSIPEIAEKVIMKCLEKDPAKRFQRAKEIAVALDTEELDYVKSTTQTIGTKKCPFCGLEIAISAIKCKHCKTFLDNRYETSNLSSAPTKPLKTKTTQFSSRAPLFILIAIGIWGVIIVILFLFFNKTPLFFKPSVGSIGGIGSFNSVTSPLSTTIPSLEPTQDPFSKEFLEEVLAEWQSIKYKAFSDWDITPLANILKDSALTETENAVRRYKSEGTTFIYYGTKLPQVSSITKLAKDKVRVVANLYEGYKTYSYGYLLSDREPHSYQAYYEMVYKNGNWYIVDYGVL